MMVKVEADMILLAVTVLDVVLILLHQLIGGEDEVVVVPMVTGDVEEAGVDFDLDVTIVIEEVDVKLFVVTIDSGNGRGRELVGVRVGVEWSRLWCGATTTSPSLNEIRHATIDIPQSAVTNTTNHI